MMRGFGNHYKACTSAFVSKEEYMKILVSKHGGILSELMFTTASSC
jgi:hypothetical protein